MPRFRRSSPFESSVTALVILCAVNLVAAGILAYANSFNGPFVLDDFAAITHNPTIQSLWPPRWLAAPPLSTPSGRPVLNFTLALNYAIGGFGVPGYHVLNLTVHLAAGLALFGVVRRTLLSERLRERFASVALPLAFASALLWIGHPLTTAAVTYVVQRGESLAALFLLLTLYCAIRGWTAAAVAACAIGMGSKETMIVAPAIVMLWDRTFSDEGARRWQLYAALAATLLVLMAPMLSQTQGRTALSRLLGYTAKAPGDTWTPWSYLWTQAAVIAHYLALAFVPRRLVFDYYDWPAAHSPLAVLPQAALITALLAVTILAVARKWPAGFAGAVFFLVLAPTSSLLPIPTEVAAEHRMYLPLAAVIALTLTGGFALAGGRAADALRADQTPRLRISLAALLIVVLIGEVALTRARNRDYATARALWNDTVRKRPGNARARVYYGLELMADNRYAGSEALMRGTLPLDMDPAMRGHVYLQLGTAVAAQGRLAEAVPLLERARELDPALGTAGVMLSEIRRRLANR